MSFSKLPKGLSAKTVRNINQVISSAMDFAIDQKLIAANPTDGCALPKLEHREMKTFPAEQMASFLREAKERGVFEMYYIELATGLRRDELLGLRWEDIDLERGTIQVRRQIARINGEVVEAQLKTKNSYRSVSIGQDAVEIFKEQQRSTASEYVFPSPTGGPISPDSVLHMLHRVLKRAGLPQIRQERPSLGTGWIETSRPAGAGQENTAEALRARAVTDLILCAVPVAFRGQKWYNSYIKLCCGMGRALWQTATF